MVSVTVLRSFQAPDHGAHTNAASSCAVKQSGSNASQHEQQQQQHTSVLPSLALAPVCTNEQQQCKQQWQNHALKLQSPLCCWQATQVPQQLECGVHALHLWLWLWLVSPFFVCGVIVQAVCALH
jgi:hypothetical protein